MNRKSRFFLTCFLFIALTSHSLAGQDLTVLVKKIQPAVVTVITYDRNNDPLKQGSGFFIDGKNHLVTNYHILKAAYCAEVKTYDGKRYPIKQVVAENESMDLIKVLVDIPEESLHWLDVAEILPPIAERVVVVGSPLGLE